MFYHFYHFCISFHHLCFQRCKNFPKNGKLQFSSNFLLFLSFFSFFFIFYHLVYLVFIIFASSGAIIFQKMENCNCPRAFHFFIVLSFFIMCFHFFIFLTFVYHGSSFLLLVVQKFSELKNCNFPRVVFIFFHLFIIC